MLFPLRPFDFSRPFWRLALLLALALPAPLFAQAATRTITATAGGASSSQTATSDPSLPPPGAVAAPLPDRDDDGDGLTYFEEMQRGSDPALPDTDGDGVPDPEDGWPRESRIKLPPLAPVAYAVVPLRPLGYPSDAFTPRLADDGTILFYAYTWPVQGGRPSWAFRRFDPRTGVTVPIADIYACGLTYEDYETLQSLFPSPPLLGALNLVSNPTWSGYLSNPNGSFDFPEDWIDANLPLPKAHFTGTTAVAASVGLDGSLQIHPGFAPMPFPAGGDAPFQIARRMAANAAGDFVTLEVGHWRRQLAGEGRLRYDSTYRHAATFLHRTSGEVVKLGAGISETWSTDSNNQASVTYSGSLFIPRSLTNSAEMVGVTLSPRTSPDSYSLEALRPTVWDGSAFHTSSLPGRSSYLDASILDARPEHPPLAVAATQDAPGCQWLFLDPASPPTWEGVRFWHPLGLKDEDFLFSKANRRLEMIGWRAGPVIVRNQVITELAGLVPPSWGSFFPSDINNNGVLLANAKRTVDAQGQPISSAQQAFEPVLLYPIELTSEDRLVKGSFRIPEGWTDVSLSLRATATGGLDLGTFAKLEPGAADSPTYIYASADDILSDDELDQSQNGTLDPRANSQQVVFYRDADDPRRLHFATAFDQTGEIELALSFGPAERRVTATLTHTLVAQTEAAGLLATLDQRIESLDIPEVVDFDLDLDGDGIPDGGPGDLVSVRQPGTPSEPGPFVAEAAEDDPDNLVLLLNTDDDNFDGETDDQHPTLDPFDDDLAHVVLRAPANLATQTGTLTLTHGGGSALRLRLADGGTLASGASVDLAAPSGPLAGLASGPLTLYAEGLASAADVAITLAYTPAGSSAPTVTDTAHLQIADPAGFAALQARHRYFARSGDLGGIFSRSYAANGAYRQHRLDLAPIGEDEPLQNRGLLAKTLLPLVGGLKSQAAYFRGIADGFCFGIKSDGEALGDTFFYVVMEDNRLARAKALATQFAELAKAYYGIPPWQRPLRAAQLGATLIRGFYTDAEAALGWDPILPGIDPQVLSYMAGLTTGFVTEQVAVALIPVGGTAAVFVGKVSLVAREAVAAFKIGRDFALPVFDAGRKAAVKITQAMPRIGRTEEEARNAVQASQMARRVEMPGGLKVPQVVDELFKARPQLREDILAIWQKGLPATAVAGPKRFAYMEVDLARFLAHYGDEAASLPEDAVKGYAYAQGRLFKTGEDSASRGADLEKLFGGLDTPAKREAFKESLIAYKQAVEIDAEAPLWIKNVADLHPNAYRYDSFMPDGGWGNFAGTLPDKPEGWWCSFDFYDNKYIATDRLLLPLQTSAPLYRFEFATTEIVNKARIGRAANETKAFFEPLTRDYPRNFIGGGTSIQGAATQFKATGVDRLLRVIDMNTGIQVWPAP